MGIFGSSQEVLLITNYWTRKGMMTMGKIQLLWTNKQNCSMYKGWTFSNSQNWSHECNDLVGLLWKCQDDDELDSAAAIKCFDRTPCFVNVATFKVYLWDWNQIRDSTIVHPCNIRIGETTKTGWPTTVRQKQSCRTNQLAGEMMDVHYKDGLNILVIIYWDRNKSQGRNVRCCCCWRWYYSNR